MQRSTNSISVRKISALLIILLIACISTCLCTSLESTVMLLAQQEFKALTTTEAASSSLLSGGGSNEGILGVDIALNASNPIKFQLSPIRADINIKAIDPRTYLVGNFSLRVANNVVREGFSLPNNLKKSPLTEMAFLTLDLTNVKPSFPSQNNTIIFKEDRLTLSVTITSWIPTFFMIDPTTYQLFLYNETLNEFQVPSFTIQEDYGYLMDIGEAYGKAVTFGAFVYKELEMLSFGKAVSIYYPRTIMYTITNSDLLKIAYSFPLAEYMTRSVLGSYIIVDEITFSSYAIPTIYATLGRFDYFQGESKSLNLTSSFVTIQFKTDSNTNYYYDVVAKKNVKIDVNSIGCMFGIGGSLYNPISMTLNDGILTCFMSSAFSPKHELFIVAKKIEIPLTPISLKNDHSETVVVLKNEKALYKVNLLADSIATFSSKYPTASVWPTFYVAKGYIPTETKYDTTLVNGNGQVSSINNGQDTVVYILIVNLGQDIGFSFSVNINNENLPKPTPNTTPSSFSIVYIIVPIIVLALLSIICIVAGIIVFITRRRRRNSAVLKADPYLNATLLQQSAGYTVPQPTTTQYYRPSQL